MIATHPFETARESVLPLWSPVAQVRRSAPDARTPELFVFLHGMLFTNIRLDDFSPTLARFLERLSIEEPEAREWTMMAAINIGALLEYARPQGVLRRADIFDRIPFNFPSNRPPETGGSCVSQACHPVDGLDHISFSGASSIVELGTN